jgi:hypothetical protein
VKTLAPNAAVYLDASDPETGAVRRRLLFFKRQQYIEWDVDSEKPVPGFPRDIREDWPGLLETFPEHALRGALYVPQWRESKLLFLFETQPVAVEWDIASNRAGKVHRISGILPSKLTADGDACLVSAETADGIPVIYGFREQECTRWTVNSDAYPAQEDEGYPRRTAEGWKDGLVLAPKSGVYVHWRNRSSAHSNRKIYFFLGDLYLRWDVPSDTRNYRLDIVAGWKQWPDFE